MNFFQNSGTFAHQETCCTTLFIDSIKSLSAGVIPLETTALYPPIKLTLSSAAHRSKVLAILTKSFVDLHALEPTKPIGEVGRDAFGNVPYFEDRGERLRGILAIGRQDVNIGGLTPLDEGVIIITASSDHLLVDIEDCPVVHKVGEILRFRLDYPGMLSSSTSLYVTKIYEG